jgi:hypothetical protein
MHAHKTMWLVGIGPFAVVLLLLAARVAMAGEITIQAAIRAAGSASVEVVERYEATSPFSGTELHRTLPYMSQPFADLAARLLRLAGVMDIVEVDGEIRLTVEALGTTEAVLYDTSIGGQRIRDTTFRSSNLKGTIRIETDVGSLERPFTGSIPAPFDFMVTFGYDPYSDPSNAPFREAFEAPGGYADTIARLLAEIYGPGILDRAATVEDPLIRPAADLATQN